MADRVYGRNFGRVPDELLWDKTISDGACRLYAALTRYGQQRDRIVPGRKELAERLGWSLDKLDKRTRELESTGALYVERRTGARGQSRTQESIYWLDGLTPSRKSAASPSRQEAANDSRQEAATIRAERDTDSPNGESGPTPQTIIAAWHDDLTARAVTWKPDGEETKLLGAQLKRMLGAGATQGECLDELRAYEQRPVAPTNLCNRWRDTRKRKAGLLTAPASNGRRRTAADNTREILAEMGELV